MNDSFRRNKQKLTPEKTQAWTLAMYPAIVIALAAFMIITDRKITTDIIGLFVGLIVAGSLQAVVKKNGQNVKFNDSDGIDGGIHNSSREKLAKIDRSWTDDIDRWRNSRICLWSS